MKKINFEDALVVEPAKVSILDEMPVGTIVEYDGDEVPAGWEEVEDESLLAYNGYSKLDNGLILQWGHTKYTFTKQQEFTIAFPLTFPNACLNVTGNLSDVGFGDSDLTTSVGIYTFNPINFSGTIKSNHTSEQKDIGVYWIAIGY